MSNWVLEGGGQMEDNEPWFARLEWTGAAAPPAPPLVLGGVYSLCYLGLPEAAQRTASWEALAATPKPAISPAPPKYYSTLHAKERIALIEWCISRNVPVYSGYRDPGRVKWHHEGVHESPLSTIAHFAWTQRRQAASVYMMPADTADLVRFLVVRFARPLSLEPLPGLTTPCWAANCAQTSQHLGSSPREALCKWWAWASAPVKP